ncbi:hypothetical protein L210DRAFT_3587204 [Boletus edulis BED1]|uniref:Secreted protein n=1 Tax=Boletus edulis BED1 TaxID=1328754 RepID=A0AAD4BAF4_BOLED|nr:hypothetical protein L210DRAFT_3587204 [Boletus edulis BED1]
MWLRLLLLGLGLGNPFELSASGLVAGERRNAGCAARDGTSVRGTNCLDRVVGWGSVKNSVQGFSTGYNCTRLRGSFRHVFKTSF